MNREEIGYESEDSDIGESEDEEEGTDAETLDSEFNESHPASGEILADFFEGELSDIEEEPPLDYSHILEGDLSDLTDIETTDAKEENHSSSCLGPNHPPGKNKKKRKQKTAESKLKKRIYQWDLRANKQAKQTDGAYSKAVGQRRVDESEVTQLPVDAQKFPISSTGYQGLRTDPLYASWNRKKILKELQYIDWDGR